MRSTRRPLSHFAILAFNVGVAGLLVIVGAGMLWTGQRLSTRQVVSIGRDENAKPIDDANITPSEEWNLTEGDLCAICAEDPSNL